MLILSAVLVLVMSVAAVALFWRRSYIKNRVESLCLIAAMAGFNLTCFSICLYYAQHGPSSYVLNNYLFLSQEVLIVLRGLRMNLFAVSNLLNFGRLLFVGGIYCFVTIVIDRRMSVRRDWLLGLPVLFILLNLSPVYIRLVTLFQKLPVAFPHVLNFFDQLGSWCMLLALFVLALRLWRCFRTSSDSVLRRSSWLLLAGLVLIWVEYLLIFDLTPSSLANIYKDSFVISALTSAAVKAVTSSTVWQLNLISLLMVVCPFALVIFPSISILRCHNYKKAGSITVSRSIAVGDTKSLIPFLHTFKNQLVSLHQFECLMDRDNFGDTYPVVRSITEELMQMTDDLYANAREVKLSITLYSVDKCLGDAVKNVQRVRDVPIRFDNDRTAFAMIDPEYIRHAFENILHNAVDACEEVPGGEIRIAVTERPRHIQVVVSDNGVGIGRESLGQIFDPFFSTKMKTHSWGMGLNYMLRIIKAHGGRVHYDSEPGKGTDVTVLIPTGR